ncbi:unnamed protein product [Dibothriocephalus latus]|uniref:SWIM-type domain-containing protein n=1 Tax=Dibothriocephalus latus TaxID=60516 RepID=A0A3P7PLC7_DIBLA|nr:unnamed protein product [Dibothriocephalus latus]
MSSHSGSPHSPLDLDSDMDLCEAYSSASDLDLDLLTHGLSGIPKLWHRNNSSDFKSTSPESLLSITARYIAANLPFEVVELSPFTVPEELQKLIAFYSFPTDEADIWLYSCLSVGGSYAFTQGELLWAKGAVRDCMQIGFHLSANVVTGVGQTVMSPPVPETTLPPVPPISNLPPSVMQDQLQPHTAFELKPNTVIHRVSLAFDRQRITSCSCTCTADIDEDVQLYRPAPFLPPPVDNDRFSATAQGSNTYLHSYYTPDLMAFSRTAPAPNYASAISAVPGIVGEHASAAAAARCFSGFVSPYGIWCSHVVAACLLRIRSPNSVLLRAPISESLSKLSKVELQKFAQNLICQMGAKKVSPEISLHKFLREIL